MSNPNIDCSVRIAQSPASVVASVNSTPAPDSPSGSNSSGDCSHGFEWPDVTYNHECRVSVGANSNTPRWSHRGSTFDWPNCPVNISTCSGKIPRTRGPKREG